MQTNILTFFGDFLKYTPKDLENCTLGVIKPDLLDFYYRRREEAISDITDFDTLFKEIMDDIRSFGFDILFAAPYNIKPIAEYLYAEHDAKHNGGTARKFFPGLVNAMSSGNSGILLLRHAPVDDKLCYELWRKAIGPKNPREGSMETLRHKYYNIMHGDDFSFYDSGCGTNGFHGSDSLLSFLTEFWKILCAMYRDAWFKQCKDGKCPIQMVAV